MRLAPLPLIGLITLFALPALFSSSSARAANAPWFERSVPVRIMALGDSITAGVGAGGIDTGSGGYRTGLERWLDDQGYHYAMTGARSDYSKRARMPRHEGWPGYVIRSFPSDPAPQLYGAVTKRAIAHDRPDVILLMAGTNDLLRLAKGKAGYTIPHIVASMNALIAEIFSAQPDVAVIVAGVVDSPRVRACDVARFDGSLASGCTFVNGPNLRTLVEHYHARGYRIAYAADMATAVRRDAVHFPDGIHPSGPDGYNAMARVWARAIEEETYVPNQEPP